jgi:hypothetical protein
MENGRTRASEQVSECMANISLSLFAFNIAVYIVTGVDARNIIINISFHVMKLRNFSSKSIKFFLSDYDEK